MTYWTSYLKFVLKRTVSAVRSFLIFFLAAPVNVDRWAGRILIVNLQALGDLVIFTSVLKHYKKRFPDKKIYLLIKTGIGLEKFLISQFADEIIALNYRKFAVNPFYGVAFINHLRRIGFEQVINHDFSASEIMGKIISVELGARKVIGYEGLASEWRVPFDFQQKKNLKIVKEKILPRYSKIIKSIDLDGPIRGRLPSAVSHYVAIYEGATGFKEDDYSLDLGGAARGSSGILQKFGLVAGRYAIFNVSASVSYKRWPLFRFSKVAEEIRGHGIKTVLVGSKKDRGLGDKFVRCYGADFMNLSGQTPLLRDLVELAENCLFIFTNDTSLTHFAIALKKPSICLAGGGQFGMFQNYGYADINKWLWKKTDCYFDSWRCGRGLPTGVPAPCVAAVPLSVALEATKSLLKYLGADRVYPGENFCSEFEIKIPEVRRRGLKIIYAGIRNENYNPRRAGSFEYMNFYPSLKDLPDAQVIEYPYESIVILGKKKFNAELLDLIKSERADLFFAFMFTDEFDKKVLDEIKKLTTSVAWFSDDHWRIWNYSRHWAPHFTWAVTTWSRAIEIYARWGIKNVIRSQWGFGGDSRRSVNVKKDLDVSFAGQYNNSRVATIRALREAGLDICVRGWGWSGDKLLHEDVARFFLRSKINLNLNTTPSHWSYKMLGRLLFRRSVNHIVPDFWNFRENLISWWHMRIPQIKARLFEISGYRTFLISARGDDSDAYYEDGKEIVYYDGSIGDLVKKIQYYLAHDNERERIARAGYERTINEHTYEERFKELFQKIGLRI